ncbi:MAG: hypothetical protein ACLRPC_07110 [Streptococcus sp.]
MWPHRTTTPQLPHTATLRVTMTAFHPRGWQQQLTSERFPTASLCQP